MKSIFSFRQRRCQEEERAKEGDTRESPGAQLPMKWWGQVNFYSAISDMLIFLSVFNLELETAEESTFSGISL